MQFHQSDPNRLKVTLTQAELEQAGLTFDELGPDSPQTHALLSLLLEAAYFTTGFLPGGRVIIEARPEETGDCTFYISNPGRARWKVRRPEASPVIYRFDDVDVLISSAIKLFRRCSHRIRKSALYRLENSWRLALYPLDTMESITLPFMDEYAPRCGQGELATAWLGEHGQLVVAENAVDLLSAYFG